jgi:putative phosphoribosyl transferase
MWTLKHLAVGDGGREGALCLAPDGTGLVLFCHADGQVQSSRRHASVARRLQQRGLSTLLFELLTPQEAAVPARLDDIELLLARVLQAIERLPAPARELPLGLLGTDGGAAAALVADTRLPNGAGAIVARGGRPELAASALAEVRAPTLLIVGEADPQGLAGNRRAYALLRCEKRIEIVPRASHQFLEAGALDAVALAAADWFCSHLLPGRRG